VRGVRGVDRNEVITPDFSPAKQSTEEICTCWQAAQFLELRRQWMAERQRWVGVHSQVEVCTHRHKYAVREGLPKIQSFRRGRRSLRLRFETTPVVFAEM